ncbi:hypothetical protein SAY87_001884 [Trapa incisa]|uniref:Ycf20-like protein n=2 Tax=Trapa TaxID=22665 RepID=A0AAN7KDH2_TRANT|nr:hypothetical protein SAY87_001884 [Trapa incisa]KAK4765159.1 hypothetical protein SAY86_026249 [Trapa natans]
MVCLLGAATVQRTSMVMETEACERLYIAAGTSCFLSLNNEASFSGQPSNISLHGKPTPFFQKSLHMRRHSWKLSFSLNTDGISGNGNQEDLNGDNTDLNRTRLGRIVIAGGRQLLQKLNSARKNFPMKIFLLLLGFYTANALATILGQTGDWDVLVAGVVVAAIEGIGMLMYKKPPSLGNTRFQSFVVMINYWKAGVCLGLFVDAFKLGS